MKKKTNKWQFIFRHERDYMTMDRAWRNVDIGVVNFTSFPPEGASIDRKHFRGIWIKFSYWFPIRFR